MTTERRVVIDTGVLISAALVEEGKPHAAVLYVLGHDILLGSTDTFNELETRLRRSKFRRYLQPEKQEAYLTLIRERSRFIPVTETITACRDPKDDKFLELAASGQADLIIASDHDLLVLHPFRGIPILRPAAFLDTVTS
jgi:putative PIN family toxin of toxin-antitoxin system